MARTGRGALAAAAVVGLLAFGSARSATVSATLSADGTVEAPRQAALGFASPGRLVEVDVGTGDSVRKGQLLARLDQAPAESALASAEAGLAAARAQLLQLEHGLSPAERAEQRVGVRRARESSAGAERALCDARAAARVDAARLRTAIDQASAALAASQLVNSSPFHSARRVNPIAAAPKRRKPASSKPMIACSANCGYLAFERPGLRPSGRCGERRASAYAVTTAPESAAAATTPALAPGDRRRRSGRKAASVNRAAPAMLATSIDQAVKR